VNGLIDTSRTAIDNLELIGNSCATWITYDVQDGKWAVVINRAGDSVYSFDDDNIIGSIKLNGTGLIDQYNGVEVRFPHRDLNDQEDFIRIEIPLVDRLPNEPENILTMDLPVLNEPVQAQIVGLIELKQARLDKIITFQSDYSKINLQAGNIIDVTNSVYGWTNKEFRIIRMEETDVDGAIVIEITALEYDDNIYSLDDLYRYVRTSADGILTQGALGPPTTPTIVKFEFDPNPRVEISSITPNNTDPLNQNGIIEAMEFWISTDGTNYTLLSTLRPAPPALIYAASTTVTFPYNNIGTNFYVKTRCSNSTTTSEFSSPASVIFAPLQVTDVVDDQTLAVDSGGNIMNTLGLAGLLGLLNGLIAQINPDAAGGIFDKYNTTYNNVTGKDLSQATVAVENTALINDTTTMAKLNAMSASTLTYGRYENVNVDNRANWISYGSVIGPGWDTLICEFTTPACTWSYYYWDGSAVRFESARAQPAFDLYILYGASLATATVIKQTTIDWNSNYNRLAYNAPASGTYWFAMTLIPTYDLNMYWTVPNGGAAGEPNTIFPINFGNLGAGSTEATFTVRVTST
jgi:hypothetical protein